VGKIRNSQNITFQKVLSPSQKRNHKLNHRLRQKFNQSYNPKGNLSHTHKNHKKKRRPLKKPINQLSPKLKFNNRSNIPQPKNGRMSLPKK
jgi:hypothetical protein